MIKSHISKIFRYLIIITIFLFCFLYSKKNTFAKMDRLEDYTAFEDFIKSKDNSNIQKIKDESNTLKSTSLEKQNKENNIIDKKVLNKIPKTKLPGILQERKYKINEMFILTDKTKANTFKISSEKSWEKYKDNILVTLDLFAQENDNGSTRLKRQRFEFDYKFYLYNFRENQPFFEYHYSIDKPTQVTWKVFSGGVRKKIPLSMYLDLGYGYKWGSFYQQEDYRYDVVTVSLASKRKFSNIILEQNLKTITPRSVEQEKQPIYDYQSSISIPIIDNLSGTVNFDWRYQKIASLEKDEWFNYTLKFGLTFIPKK